MRLQDKRKEFFFIFLFFSITLIILQVIVQEKFFGNQAKELVLKDAHEKVFEREEVFQNFLKHSKENILILRNENGFKEYLKDNKNKNVVENMFLSIMKSHLNIDQIRYIDKNGFEKVRVHRNNKLNILQITPNRELQDKSNRYYFIDSKSKVLEKLWISKLDLNIEYQEIDKDKPTIRVIIPIEEENHFNGILVINYDLKDFLNELFQEPLYDMILCDGEGNSIIHYDSTKNWDLYSKNRWNISKEFPKDYENILKDDFYYTDDLVTKKLDLEIQNGLKLILQVKKSYVKSLEESKINQYIIVSIIILIFSFLLSLLIAKLLGKLFLNLDEMRKLNQSLNLASQIANIGFWEYDDKSKKISWSEGVYKIFEIDDNTTEINYEKFLSYLSDDEKEKINTELALSIKEKREYFITHKIVTENGNLKYVEQKAKHYFDKRGNLGKTIGSIYDVSERFLSEEKYKTLLNFASDGIHILDLKGNILQFSESFSNTLGYTFEETKNLNVKDWDESLEQEKLTETIKDIIKEPKLFYTKHKKKDGSLIDVQINAKGINIGGINYLYASQRDISEQKEKEQLLLEKTLEQKNLLSLFDKSNSILFRWNNDKDWNINYVSSNVKDLLGYTKKEFLSSSIVYLDCIFKDDLPFVIEEKKEARNSKKDFFKHKPYRIITKNNDIKWVLEYTVLSKNEKGDTNYFLGYIIDITTEILLREELIDAKKKAEYSNKVKSEFLANMSHEIRTPLNGVIGLTNLILDTQLNDIQRNYLGKVKQSSNTLLHLLNDILDSSKMEAGKLNLIKQEFNIEKLFSNISDLFGYKAFEKKLDFTFCIDHTIPNILIGDSLRLTQILNNLVGNSIKFTKHGFIAVKVNVKNQSDNKISLEFCVHDTGIGISEDNQKKLFQSFEQLDNSNTRNYAGTGLGLMITKQIVELMHGKIWLESKEEFGSKFYFNIQFEYKKEQPKDRLSIKDLTKKRFLIVDDNKTARNYLNNILNAWNIDTLSLSNGFEALEILEKEKFDYLLIDWNMPDIDKLELLEKLKNKNINLESILMITAFEEKTFLEKAKEKGVKIDKILNKPYTPSDIYNTLFKKIDKPKLLKNDSEILKLKDTKKALLVEDNDINEIVSKALLEKYGFSVDIANDGLEAIIATKKNSYDIIFMDLQMPNMDGFDTSKEIRTFNTSIPIIALSAAVMKEDKKLTKSAGMDYHISKPIDEEEFEKLISYYFDTLSDNIVNKASSGEMEIYGIDFNKLKKSLANDEILAINLLKKYYENYKDADLILKNLKINSKEFQEYIHKLKGVNGNIQASKVYELCAEVEIQENEKAILTTKKIIDELKLVLKSIKTKILNIGS